MCVFVLVDKEDSFDVQLKINSVLEEDKRVLTEDLEEVKRRNIQLSEQNEQNITLIRDMTINNKSEQERATKQLDNNTNQLGEINAHLTAQLDKANLEKERVTIAYEELREKQNTDEIINQINTSEIGTYYADLLNVRNDELNKLKHKHTQSVQDKIQHESKEKILNNTIDMLQTELASAKQELTITQQLLNKRSVAEKIEDGYRHERASSPKFPQQNKPDQGNYLSNSVCVLILS